MFSSSFGSASASPSFCAVFPSAGVPAASSYGAVLAPAASAAKCRTRGKPSTWFPRGDSKSTNYTYYYSKSYKYHLQKIVNSNYSFSKILKNHLKNDPYEKLLAQ